MSDQSQAPLLAVSNLSVTFRSEAGDVHAVRSLSYDVRPGELLGIVGESGSGKSVSSLAIMNLLPGHARVTGSVTFQGQELIGQSDAALSAIRGKRIAMVFQDPLSALTPVYSVGNQIAEAILAHDAIGRKAAAEKAVDLLELVGIPNPRQRAAAFPHEFSGRHASAGHDCDGDRQRSGADHRRRADHRARRDDPGADSGRAAEGAHGHWSGDHPDHARPRGHRRRRRPRRRDVRRYDCRNGRSRRCVLSAEDAVHARPAGFDSAG